MLSGRESAGFCKSAHPSTPKYRTPSKSCPRARRGYFLQIVHIGRNLYGNSSSTTFSESASLFVIPPSVDPSPTTPPPCPPPPNPPYPHSYPTLSPIFRFEAIRFSGPASSIKTCNRGVGAPSPSPTTVTIFCAFGAQIFLGLEAT